MSIMNNDNNPDRRKYLTLLGAWALAFGCSVGWGSFVMPGSTFLPIGGPMGTTLGIGIGGLSIGAFVMILGEAAGVAGGVLGFMWNTGNEA